MSEYMNNTVGTEPTNPNGPGSRLIREKNMENEPKDSKNKPWKERLAEATQILLKYKGGRASLEQSLSRHREEMALLISARISSAVLFSQAVSDPPTV